MRLVDVDQMRAIEAQAVREGISYVDMMENAGRNLGMWINDTLVDVNKRIVLGLIGSGNNGGDTLIGLDYLAHNGWEANAYLVHPRPENDQLVKRLLGAGGKIAIANEDVNFQQLSALTGNCGILLDGVVGTGFKSPMKPDVAAVLTQASKVSKRDGGVYIVAVDCPSGVDCNTGETADEVIPADTTVCMAAVKKGLLRFPAFPLVGKIVTVSIGLPEDWKGYSHINNFVLDQDAVAQMLPPRPLDSHKGTFGTVLVVAGSINFTGAAFLAGKAAYRAGAGLVIMAVPAPLYPVLAGQFPEGTWVLLPHEQGVFSPEAADLTSQYLRKATVGLLGPGWGLEEPTYKFLVRILGAISEVRPMGVGFAPGLKTTSSFQVSKELPPLVIDADGLKLLARIKDWPKILPEQSILTPHPGEMSILCGLSKDEIQTDRLAVARQFAQKWGHVVVLKGALTVVASPDGRSGIVPVATPALARAGTGDVLAGIIAGLRAGGIGAFEASQAGAWIHSQAGLLAAEKLGTSTSVVAGDVLESISGVFSKIEQ